MIVHCVFCRFRGDVPPAQRREVLDALREFSIGLDGVLSFEWGPNRDFENRSAGYSDGFVIRFADAVALQRYARHETHKALGTRLCALCEGGAEGIMVFDLETSGAAPADLSHPVTI